MSKKIDLPSGAILEITLMPYEEAWQISQKVASVIEKVNIDFGSINIADLKENGLAIFELKNPFCKVLADPTIIEAAKFCWKRATVNGLKIDSSTFEKVELRKDFLPVVFHILFENVSPFFSDLPSYFMTRLSTAIKN